MKRVDLSCAWKSPYPVALPASKAIKAPLCLVSISPLSGSYPANI